MSKHVREGIVKLVLLSGLAVAGVVAQPRVVGAIPPMFCSTCDCCRDPECPLYHWYVCGLSLSRCDNHSAHYCNN